LSIFPYGVDRIILVAGVSAGLHLSKSAETVKRAKDWIKNKLNEKDNEETGEINNVNACL